MGCLSSSLPPYVPAEVGLCSFCDWIYQRCKLDGNEKHRSHERRIVLFLRGIIQQEKTIHLRLTCQQAIDPLTSVSLNLISLIYSTSKVFLFCSPKTIGDEQTIHRRCSSTTKTARVLDWRDQAEEHCLFQLMHRVVKWTTLSSDHTPLNQPTHSTFHIPVEASNERQIHVDRPETRGACVGREWIGARLVLPAALRARISWDW